MCLVDVDIDSSPWKLTVPAELVDQRSTTVKKSELLEIASRFVEISLFWWPSCLLFVGAGSIAESMPMCVIWTHRQVMDGMT